MVASGAYFLVGLFCCLMMIVHCDDEKILIEHQAGEMFFHCKPVPVSSAAHDSAAAMRLWELSMKLCNLNK